jgi:putative chitinase
LREATPPLLDRRTTDDIAAEAMREAGGTPVTTRKLLAITNQPGNRVDEFVGPLNASMAANGIISPSQQAAFLSQVAQETWGFTRLDENLNYGNARLLLSTFPRHFADIQDAQQYVRNPTATANRVYANRMLNGDENSGDGYLYRGRGGIMLTGRQNYRTYGYESDPDALLDPRTGMEVGARYWRSTGLNQQTSSMLNRSQFDNVTRAINGGGNGAATRWNYYRRALRAVP